MHRGAERVAVSLEHRGGRRGQTGLMITSTSPISSVRARLAWPNISSRVGDEVMTVDLFGVF